MQIRVSSNSSLEEGGKDPGNLQRAGHVRALPWRLLLLLIVFLGSCLVISFFSMFSVRKFGIANIVPIVRPSFRPCDVIEPTRLDQWIKPPSNLNHSMSDEELFWRASFAPRMKKYPYARTPKIAFMFLTKGPLPFAPLWEKFFNGNEEHYSIYIHSLPAYNEEFPSSSVFYKRHIPSQVSIRMGKMSMCDAERRLLANALLDIANEYFILLSESCIPLANFSSIYRYISKSRYSFIGAIDDLSVYGRGRYHPNMTPEVNLTEWRKGSQWFEINRKLAFIIIQDKKYYPKFEEYCKPHACYVDEHYFPTMLTIEAPELLANRTLTWVDWSRGGAHPATYGKDDVSAEFFGRIIGDSSCVYNDQPGAACFLFARKFAPNALEALLELAPTVFRI
ncbi:uncharacterized protein [Phyllobates terribilis]|uniref:uncharacterized protein n=1 Tax=Phyllobates terribilis TaxID=111132 RepID=UPI003CCA79BB